MASAVSASSTGSSSAWSWKAISACCGSSGLSRPSGQCTSTMPSLPSARACAKMKQSVRASCPPRSSGVFQPPGTVSAPSGKISVCSRKAGVEKEESEVGLEDGKQLRWLLFSLPDLGQGLGRRTARHGAVAALSVHDRKIQNLPDERIEGENEEAKRGEAEQGYHKASVVNWVMWCRG